MNAKVKRVFHLWSIYALSLVFATLIIFAPRANAQNEVLDSPSPILISETNSTRALAMDAPSFRGDLPRSTVSIFNPNAQSRAVIFVTNLSLMDGEGANAFRVYVQNAQGKISRLTVENIKPLRRQNWIYALTIRLFDENKSEAQLPPGGDVVMSLSWRGMTSNRVLFGWGAIGGRIKGAKGAVPTPAPLSPPPLGQPTFAYNNSGDRSRSMEQAAFGPTPALDLRLRQIGIQRWIEEQFNQQPTVPYPDVPEHIASGQIFCSGDQICLRDFYSQYSNQNWQFREALYGDDQLRRRVSWALAQTWVVSGSGMMTQPRWIQEYIEILDRNAFGNWRDLMQEMTLNPAMGNFLDMMRSTKNNPNENYPREVLQLFNVGLFILNQDGTPILDAQGLPLPTYDQDKITNFTKVFTGWAGCNQAPPACPNAVPGIPNFIDPMLLSSNNHDLTAKSLFSYTQVNGQPAPFSQIPACAGCTSDGQRTAYANASLSQTLDNIFYHPNVAPFVSRLLIQHLVTGDPSPAYVGRVAAQFNDNGQGVRGDLKAVIRAILLDPEARGSRKTAPDYGKLREPFELVTNISRQFDAESADRSQQSDGYLNPQTSTMDQNVWNSPTVFNFYPPNYVVPGTDLNSPEFGIMNSGTSFARSNFVNKMVYGRINCTGFSTCSPTGNAPLGTSISLAQPQTWAQADLNAGDANYTQLIEGLNQKMMHGTMSDQMKSSLRAGIRTIPANAPNRALAQAEQAVYLTATSSQYQIQR